MPNPWSDRAEEFANATEWVKFAVAQIIRPVAPLAKVERQFVWSPNDNNWVGLLRSSEDLDDENRKQVHTVQVYHTALDEQEEQPIRSLDPLAGIGVDIFVAYDRGTPDANSERKLIREMAILKMTLAENSDLGILLAEPPLIPEDVEMRKYVMGHNGLRFPKIGMRQFGDYALQFALGYLDVRMQSWVVR